MSDYPKRRATHRMISICQAAWVLALILIFLAVYGVGAVERDWLMLAWLIALPFVGMIGWITLEALRAIFDIALRLHTVDTEPPAVASRPGARDG